MTELDARFRPELEAVRRDLDPESLTPAKLDSLSRTWEPRARPSGKDWNEEFAVTRPDGSSTGVWGARWLFHLLGIPHRAVDIGLTTPAGLVLLQRRSHLKADNPDLWDLAVTGHVSRAGGEHAETGYRAAALRELEEELGLGPLLERRRKEMAGTAAGVDCLLVGDGLIEIGSPRADPPDPDPRWWHLNVEVRQLFGGVLSAEALAHLYLQEEEVSGVFLCSRAEARRLQALEESARREPGSPPLLFAGGGFRSFGLFLDWLDATGARLP